MNLRAAQFHVFDHGYIEASDAVFVTEDGRRETVTARWPVRCYLIEHQRGRLLWDTGLPEAKLLADPWAVGDFKKVVTTTLKSSLAAHGLLAEDITFLGLSHLHIDHAGNVNQFVASTGLLHPNEHAYAFSDDAGGDYYPEDYVKLRDSSTMLTNDMHDVFGDGSVLILEAPGHTVGHQALYVDLPGIEPRILVGDLYYAEDDRTHRRVPSWNVDIEQTFRSMDRIERIASETGARLLIHHDPNSQR